MTIVLNGSTGLTTPGVTNSGNETIAGTLNGEKYTPYAMRNRIINGACQIAQRGSVAISQNTWSYGGCDRIAAGPVGFTTFTGFLQQSPAAFTDASLAQIMGPVTTTGSGTIQFQQRIESVNCIGLNGKTITGSFWVYQTTGASITGNIMIAKPGALDNFGSQTTIASAASTVPTDTWTQLFVTTTLGGSDALNGLVLTYSAPIGAVTNRYFYITRLQLEQGPNVSPFEIRPHGLELALCQRYYETGSVFYSGSVVAGFTYYADSVFAVSKRAAPTCTFTATGGLGFSAGQGTANQASTYRVRLQDTCDASSNGGYFEGTFTASSEL